MVINVLLSAFFFRNQITCLCKLTPDVKIQQNFESVITSVYAPAPSCLLVLFLIKRSIVGSASVMRPSGIFQFQICLEVFSPANLLCYLSKQAFDRFYVVYDWSFSMHKATQLFGLLSSKLFRNLSVLFQITFAANKHRQALLLTRWLTLAQMTVPLFNLVQW